MAFAETAQLAVKIDLQGNALSGINTLDRRLKGLGGSVGRVGKGFGQIGAGIARAGLFVGGAAIVGLGLAAKAAIDFEDAFAGVKKTIDEADLAAAGLTFDDLAKSFRTMATEMPIAATELARIGEAAGALGIRSSDIVEFTRVVAQLGVTTDLSSDTAAEALGKVGTILNFTGKDYADFADVLVNLGNKGASVESGIVEVTKRFAAQGKQAGLTTPEILAYSSAILSAGAQSEAAGSSLSRLFSNLVTETALASGKGKAFAAVSGKSFKDFAKIVKNDTNGAMIDFLGHLKTLSKFDQARALEAVGITGVRDRNAIMLLANTLDTNLVPALENAKNSSGALAIEATKRFDTLKSKLIVLKQGFIEAAMTIGEGFTPALGRAADKLLAFLKVDSNKSALKAIGEDIGKAIDGIDWDEVLKGAKAFIGVLKTALSFAKTLWDGFGLLPGELKAAAAALLVLHKASGGLITQGVGNVVGGLASGVARAGASQLPGVGKLFAQPVFVTNFPPGFGAGAGAGGLAKGGLGLVSKMFLVGEAIGLAVLVNDIRSGIAEGNTKTAAALQDQTAQFIASQPNQAALENALAGVNQGIHDLEFNPLNVLVQGEALDKLRLMRADLSAQLEASRHGNTSGSPDDRDDKAVSAMKRMEERLAHAAQLTKDDTVSATDRVKVAAATAGHEARTGLYGVQSATQAGTGQIVGAIRAIPPPQLTVNVSPTTISYTTAVTNRYGPGNGSAGTSSGVLHNGAD